MASTSASERWEFVPYESAGPLRAGDTIDDARRLFGAEASNFPEADGTVSAGWREQWLFLDVRADDGRIELVQLTRRSPITPVYRSVKLKGSWQGARRKLEAIGADVREPATEAYDVDDGIVLWVPIDRKSIETAGVYLLRPPG